MCRRIVENDMLKVIPIMTMKLNGINQFLWAQKLIHHTNIRL